MYCRECGKPIASGNKFCPNCGTPIDSERIVEDKTLEPNKAEITSKRRDLSILLVILVALYVVCLIVSVYNAQRLNQIDSWANPYYSLSGFAIVYIPDIVVLVFCLIGIAKKRMLSWWYILVSNVGSLIFQIIIIGEMGALIILIGNFIYVTMAVEVLLISLLVYEYPAFIVRYHSRLAKKIEKEEMELISDCNSVICPNCSREYSAQYDGQDYQLIEDFVICPYCNYRLTREEFSEISKAD